MRHSPGSEPPPGIQGREEPANLSFLFRSTRITCGVWQALGWRRSLGVGVGLGLGIGFGFGFGLGFGLGLGLGLGLG